MSRIHPECPDSDPSDRSLAADVVLRGEPDEEPDEEEDDEEEEDEDEDESEDKEDDDVDDEDGYSESARQRDRRLVVKPQQQ
jgi:hypothetical protein